jgi:hypothetical protein
LVAAGSFNVGAPSYFSRQSLLPAPSAGRADTVGEQATRHGETAGWAGTQPSTIVNLPRSGKANCVNEKSKCLRICCPLSDPSRRRERPGTRKAYARTRPMRTNLWYSPRRRRASGKAGWFCTTGHRRTFASQLGQPAIPRWKLRVPTAEPANTSWPRYRLQGAESRRWGARPPTPRSRGPA